MYSIRKSQTEDLACLLKLYEAARERMAAAGNSQQWGNEDPPYPAEALLKDDIEKGNSYVIYEEDPAHIVGTFYYFEGVDPTYLEINGQWINDETYGTIHRIASDGKASGIVARATRFALDKNPNVRVDTHRNNKAMLAALFNAGYDFCGHIKTRDGSERLAFQLAPEIDPSWRYDEIHYGDLLLRAPRVEDAKAIREAYRREVPRYIPHKPHATIQVTEKLIADFLRKRREQSERTYIISKAGEFLGLCGLHRLKEATPSPGLWLKETAQNKGIGKKVVYALLALAKDLGYEEAIYSCHKDNVRSRALAKHFAATLIPKPAEPSSNSGDGGDVDEANQADQDFEDYLIDLKPLDLSGVSTEV